MFFLLLLNSAFPLEAIDYVRLKNGSIVRGKIAYEDDEKVLIAENEDFVRYIDKANIAQVSYEKGKLSSSSSGQDKKSQAGGPDPVVPNAPEDIDPKSYGPSGHGASLQGDTTIDVVHEIVSDFIWRGLSFSGEYANRRRNEKYPAFTFVPSYQPTITFNTPLKGFQVQFWGNFQLTERNDRDADGRFQLYPGGAGPAYLGQGTAGSLSPFSAPSPDTLNQACPFDTQNNLLSGVAKTGPTCGGQVPGFKNEQNGMKRSDGLFYAFYYSFEKTRWGTFTAGMWFYNTFQKTTAYISPPLGGFNALAAQGVPGANNTSTQITRLAWQEYYFFWKLPILEYINPTISFYTQFSQENSGLMAGKNYLSLTMNHEFFQGKFFRIQPQVNIGYAMSNNIVDNRNGVQDITSTITFSFGKFFVKAADVYRPNIYLYDTDNYYGATGGYVNRSHDDGKIVNPGKVNGPINQLILDYIAGSSSIGDPGDGSVRQALRESYLLQKIPAHLVYFAIGFTHGF
ncbi:LA_0442/LA_0875 N-terminal domain-containing protein [Leptospira perolatii]|uniref:LA_0442/LA_0875 N-terminal domain-containing protein n=1 Tax=Leptospira perolatii TaxID=2023191 RepID=UPI0013FDD06C